MLESPDVNPVSESTPIAMFCVPPVVAPLREPTPIAIFRLPPPVIKPRPVVLSPMRTLSIEEVLSVSIVPLSYILISPNACDEIMKKEIAILILFRYFI